MISSAQLLRIGKTSDASTCFPSASQSRLRMADMTDVPADQSSDRTFPHSKITTYRHDPYAYNALTDEYVDLGKRSCESIYGMTPEEGEVEGAEVPFHATVPTASDAEVASGGESTTESRVGEAKREQLDLSTSSPGEDGMSEVGSEAGAAAVIAARSFPVFENQQSVMPAGARPSRLVEVVDNFVFKFPRPSIFRYASVNFRFGSAWFIAPFRVQPGDMVVAEYPLNRNMHMGIVSGITTVKPETFYTEGNDDPNYLTDEEMETMPRLIRHARDHDKNAKLEMRNYDLSSLENACRIAEELQAPVTFLDAEWLMGMNVITFLVHVFGDVSKVDEVADELAKQEFAEVVFTYPAGHAEVI